MTPRDAWLAEVTRLHELIKAGDRSFETDELLRQAVEQARLHNATWQNIGDAIGTTRQYVNKRFGPFPPK